MKKKIKEILKNKYFKQILKNRLLKKQIKELTEELEKLKIFNIELQNKNYEISSNNEYLLKQINTYKKKCKDLRGKLNDK